MQENKSTNKPGKVFKDHQSNSLIPNGKVYLDYGWGYAQNGRVYRYADIQIRTFMFISKSGTNVLPGEH